MAETCLKALFEPLWLRQACPWTNSWNSRPLPSQPHADPAPYSGAGMGGRGAGTEVPCTLLRETGEAFALLRRRVWLGVRRYPARSTLRRFSGQGDTPLYPRRGLRPLHPAWGTGECRFVALAGRTLPDLPLYSGAGTELPPAAPLGETTGTGALQVIATRRFRSRWLSSVRAQTRASRRSGLAPLSGVQVQSWSSRSSRPGPTWKTLPCS